MAVMPALAVLARRPMTIVLLVVAGLAAVVVALALTNPWRLTALYPLDSTGGASAMLTLAGALVAAALLPRLSTGRGALVGLVVTVVAVLAIGVGLPMTALRGALRDHQITTSRVLATSPGGGFSAVALTHPDGRTEIVLRRRSGLASREGATPLARCPHDPFAGELPPESVHFTDDIHVAVPEQTDVNPTQHGPLGWVWVWVTVTFDHGTLAADHTIEMCDV
jgi:hypothetical protein